MAFKMRGWTAFDAVRSGLMGGGDSDIQAEDIVSEGGQVEYNTGSLQSVGQAINRKQLKR